MLNTPEKNQEVELWGLGRPLILGPLSLIPSLAIVLVSP